MYSIIIALIAQYTNWTGTSNDHEKKKKNISKLVWMNISFPLPGRYTTAMPQRIKTDGKIDPLTNTMIYRTHTRAL